MRTKFSSAERISNRRTLIKSSTKTSKLFLLSTLVISALLVSQISYANGNVESEENVVGGKEKVDPAVDKKPDPVAVIPPKDMFPTSFSFFELGNYNTSYAFLADKATRTLSVWKFSQGGPQFIEAHPMDLGKNPGDKFVLGDRKTPEGIYFFTQAYEGNKINFDEYGSRAFVMDYPNFFDKRNKKTGSGIWLHAIPETKSLQRGSRGCVVVRNQIIQHLSKYISLQKTPIIVVDKAEYKPMSEFPAYSAQWKNWLNDWKTAWESKTLEGYISNYGEKFESQGMNRNQWEKFKAALNEKYSYIKVKIHEPLIFIQGDKAIVRFLQAYESDVNSDFGEKFLYLSKENEKFKIVGETWSAVPADLLAQKDPKAKSSN